MKKITIVFLSVLISISIFGQEKQETTDVSTYYLIRHAEKVITDNPNPDLDSKGELRAIQWAEIFEDISFDAIYSTDYIRTWKTVKPTAEEKDVKITIYHPLIINYKKFVSETKGKTVLIVGHSNTIPQFVNELIGKNKYDQIDENCFGNLYIVDINNDVIFEKLIIIN